MKLSKLLGLNLGLAAFLLATAAPVCAQPGIASDDDVDLPQIVLPADDLENAQDGTPRGDASNLMIDTIKNQIAERYLAADQAQDVDVDQERIGALLDGSYLADYSSTSRNDPVHFSNGAFMPATPIASEAEAADASVAEAAPAASAPGAGFVMTPEAIRAMSQMSPDQIEAIALMVQISQNPDASTAPVAKASGIPALSDDDVAARSAEELLAQMAASSPATAQIASTPPEPPRVLDVGNGQDLALDNWELIVDPDGTAYLNNALLPGSRVEIEPGMTVGMFGRVIEISTDGATPYVAFESGDRIEAKAPDTAVVAAAPTALADERIAGEILVSGAPIHHDDAAPEEAPTAQASALAPEASPRPKLRPVEPELDVAKNEPHDSPVKANDPPKPAPKPEKVEEITSTSPLAPKTAKRPTAKPGRL